MPVRAWSVDGRCRVIEPVDGMAFILQADICFLYISTALNERHEQGGLGLIPQSFLITSIQDLFSILCSHE